MSSEILLSPSFSTSQRHTLKDKSCLLLLPLQREKASLNSSRRAVASVASKDTNLSFATHVLITHTRSQGLRIMKTDLLPLHLLQQDLQLHTPTARQLDIQRSIVSRRIFLQKENQMIK
jgi:hypothetical protein